ncbi:MAG: HAD-IIIA family hydrolase [archaeon]
MIAADDAFTSQKIVGYEKAGQIISALKKEGRKVALCHGGFDLLHPGHMKHFESARALCDCLFVSITSDRFVASRKGSGRPIFSERLRAYAAASLGCVDYVVISDYKGGTDVISGLRPSYYVKGPDFIHKTTPGITAEREAIRSVGGEMKYTNDPKLATTDIIRYIKEKIDDNRYLFVIDRDGTLIKNNDFLGKNPGWRDEIVMNGPVLLPLREAQMKTNSKSIVITNQAGVARKYFSCDDVEEINSYLDEELKKSGITIDDWQYCPDVDAEYAEAAGIDLDPGYVKGRTRRKPSVDMVMDSLNKLNVSIADFTRVVVIGDRPEDRKLAENLHASFIDVNGKTPRALKKEFVALQLI